MGKTDSLANMPLSLSASIQNLTQKTKESGLVCTLPQDDSESNSANDHSSYNQPMTTHNTTQQQQQYEQIKTHDTIVKVKHTDFWKQLYLNLKQLCVSSEKSKKKLPLYIHEQVFFQPTNNINNRNTHMYWYNHEKT